VLALRRVKGAFFPQCVGMTKGRFDSEVFNRSNLLKYRKIVNQPERRRCKPVLFLIVPSRRKGKVNRMFIRPLERFLIQVGSARNSAIANRKDVHRPKWSIRGVTGSRSESRRAPQASSGKQWGLGAVIDKFTRLDSGTFASADLTSEPAPPQDPRGV
jgi:hypothetical protein